MNYRFVQEVIIDRIVHMKITKHPKQIHLCLISVLYAFLTISNGYSQQEQEKVDIGFKTKIESKILKEEREIYISLPHS